VRLLREVPGIYLWHGQFLSRDRACRALSELFGCAPSPGALASAARKVAGLVAPALAAVTRHLIGVEVVHFDETRFRPAGRLAWVHSASSGKFVLVTVHPKRGKDGMKAAGVLPSFGGIAVHDAAPTTPPPPATTSARSTPSPRPSRATPGSRNRITSSGTRAGLGS
jgi:Transposase IS66 family